MAENCKTCIEAQKIISEWAGQQGHDRCWYYPDLFNKLGKLFKMNFKIKPHLPKRSEFEMGCKRYQDEEYGSKLSLK